MSHSDSFSEDGSEPMSPDALAPIGSDAPIDPASLPTPVREVVCWRCGKLTASAARCPFCLAQLAEEEFSRSPRGRPASNAQLHPIIRLMWMYLGMLATLFIYFAIANFGLEEVGLQNDRHWKQKFVMEGVFHYVELMLQLVALVWIGRPAPLPSVSIGRRIISWLLAGPALIALLGLNVAFTRALRWYVGGPPIEIELLPPKEWMAIAIATTCVLPAVLEEFFFRLLALGTLNTVSGVWQAVLVSSVMFGVAHIGNPFGIPYLILAGLVFGYFRVASGGMALPILLHFCHNGGVLILEALQ